MSGKGRGPKSGKEAEQPRSWQKALDALVEARRVSAEKRLARAEARELEAADADADAALPSPPASAPRRGAR